MIIFQNYWKCFGIENVGNIFGNLVKGFFIVGGNGENIFYVIEINLFL